MTSHSETVCERTAGSPLNYQVIATAARHPTYGYRCYWGEVFLNGKKVAGIGTFRRKADAIREAWLYARQINLPGLEPDKAPTILKADPGIPQKPCDIGLFSDAAAQTDLVDMIRGTK